MTTSSSTALLPKQQLALELEKFNSHVAKQTFLIGPVSLIAISVSVAVGIFCAHSTEEGNATPGWFDTLAKSCPIVKKDEFCWATNATVAEEVLQSQHCLLPNSTSVQTVLGAATKYCDEYSMGVILFGAAVASLGTLMILGICARYLCGAKSAHYCCSAPRIDSIDLFTAVIKVPDEISQTMFGDAAAAATVYLNKNKSRLQGIVSQYER